MQSLISDLRNLTLFYSGIRKDLADILKEADAGDERSLTESILENRNRIMQIERMNAHILQLSDNLKTSRNDLCPEIRTEAETLAAEAKSQAIGIRELCAQASEKIEQSKAAIQKDLEGIAKGKQYLKNMDPVKTNFPKFIDSTA